jgi:hypothetical protein
MLAAPSTAIDLPLKILVWEDGESKVWISHNDPLSFAKTPKEPEAHPSRCYILPPYGIHFKCVLSFGERQPL